MPFGFMVWLGVFSKPPFFFLFVAIPMLRFAPFDIVALIVVQTPFVVVVVVAVVIVVIAVLSFSCFVHNIQNGFLFFGMRSGPNDVRLLIE